MKTLKYGPHILIRIYNFFYSTLVILSLSCPCLHYTFLMSDSSSSAPKPDTAASVSQPAAPTPTTEPAPTPSTTPVTTTTAVTEPKAAVVSPLREDLIKPAVSFLSSPNVRSADKAKKIAFLQKKGLNQAEIDEAFKRSGGDDTPTTTTTTTTTVATTPANNYVS